MPTSKNSPFFAFLLIQKKKKLISTQNLRVVSTVCNREKIHEQLLVLWCEKMLHYSYKTSSREVCIWLVRARWIWQWYMSFTKWWRKNVNTSYLMGPQVVCFFTFLLHSTLSPLALASFFNCSLALTLFRKSRRQLECLMCSTRTLIRLGMMRPLKIKWFIVKYSMSRLNKSFRYWLRWNALLNL